MTKPTTLTTFDESLFFVATGGLNTHEQPEEIRNIIADLINRGANIDAMDGAGMKVIHHAILIDDLNLVKIILDSGASFESTCKDGETALELAIRSALSTNGTSILQLAQEMGVDFTAPNIVEFVKNFLANERRLGNEIKFEAEFLLHNLMNPKNDTAIHVAELPHDSHIAAGDASTVVVIGDCDQA